MSKYNMSEVLEVLEKMEEVSDVFCGSDSKEYNVLKQLINHLYNYKDKNLNDLAVK